MRDPDSNSHMPIGERRHARHVDLPIDGRLKTRLGRAITNSLIKPSSALPTLRHAVQSASVALRAQGFTDATIAAKLALLIQSLALEGGLDADSIVSGKPRWQELSERVAEWIAVDSPHDESL